MATRKQITDKVKKEAEKKKQDQKKKQQQPFQDERTHVVQRQQQPVNRNAGTVRGQINNTIQKIPDKVATSVARSNQQKQQPFRKQTLDKGSSISARIKATSPANMAEQKKQKDREGYTISGMEKNLPKELTSAVKQKAAEQKKKQQESAQKNKERVLDNSAWHQDYIDESRLSAADRANLPPSAKRQILDLKDSWEKYASDPTLSEETKAYALDKFHRAAEIYRNYYGHYSGGEAGTDYQKTQLGAVKNAPKDLQSALQTAYAYGRNALDDSYDDSELKHIMQVYSQSYKDNKDMIQNLNPEMDRMEKDYNELKKIFGTPDYNNGSGNMFENKTEPGWKGMSEEEAQAKWKRYQGLKDIFDRPWWERIGNTLYGAGKQSEAGTREAIGAFFENGNKVNPSSRFAKEGMDIRAQMEASAANQLSKEQYRKSESANIAAANAIEEAKRGGTRLDKVMVDVGVAGAQMLGDMAMSAVAPGLGTAALATRAFGGAHQQARLSGATEAEAMAYGLGVGAIEVLTNKLFSASTPMRAAYGKGLTLAGKSLDDVAEQAFGKLIKNPTMAKWVWSATSEGLEEVLADVADPILRASTYGEMGKPSVEAFASWMYDGMIGAILGGIGGAADINQVRKVGAAVIQNDVDGKAISEMIRTALKKPEGTKGREIAEELQSAMAEGQMPSAVQVGELVRENATVAEASGVINEQKTAEEVEEALDPVLKTQEYSEAEEYPEFSESDIPPEMNNNVQEEYAQKEYSEGTQQDDALSTQAILEDEGTSNIATEENASESVTAGNESDTAKEDVRQEQKILRDITDDYRLTLKGDNTNEVRNGKVEERKVSKSPAGQSGILQESAGKSVSRTQRQAEVDGKKALQRTVWEGKKFSAKDLKIKDGSAKKTATAISGAEVDGNAYLSAIRDRAKDNGVQVAFYSGALESGNMMLRGVHVQESGIIYVQVDDPEYSPEQIADHELFHVIAENDDNLVKEVAKEIQKRYTDEDLMKIAEQYIKAYDGAYDEDELDAIMEEILADAFAGMNSFANDVVEEVTKKRTGETPLRLRADVETEKERGPPDIESDEAWEILDSVGVEYDKPTASAKFSASTHNESDYVTDTKNAAKILAKALGITQKKARAYIEQVNGVAAMILSDRVRWDFKDSGLSAFVTNVEYGGSIDNSTLCSKRRVFTGTFSAIQRALPNTALTAEEFLEIRNMMKERGYEVSCGCCYVEGSRANLSRLTKEFIKKYGQTEHDYMPTVADLATPDGLDVIREEHPEVYDKYVYFMNNHGTLSKGEKALFASQQKPKMFQTATAYKGEILKQFENKDSKIDEKNDNGGIRFNSFSDTEIIHLIDNMQAIMDMSRVGLAGQGYTKQGIFARAFGGTGMKINLSLISGGLDENGKLIFDPVEGIAEEEAMELRDMYPDNVGTIIVVFNDKELLAALADDRIDYIIPFHRSQWKKSQYVKMGLRDKIKDFTNQQNEKFIKKTYHEYRGRMVPDKCTNLLPNTYWNFKKSGKWNAENYLRICAEDNRRPKFYKLLDKNPDGSYSLKKDGSTDGYWKLLIDFKMYNHITGKGVPQRPVRPDFNMDAIYNSLEEYKGGHETYPVAQDVVDDFVSEYKKFRKGVKFSGRRKTEEETDKEFMDDDENGDIETQERLKSKNEGAGLSTVDLYPDAEYGIYIKDSEEEPFTKWIFEGYGDKRPGSKVIETRELAPGSKLKEPALSKMIGKTVFVIKTGEGIVGRVKVKGVKEYKNKKEFEADKNLHGINNSAKSNSKFKWDGKTGRKFGYTLEVVEKFDKPIPLPEGTPRNRTYALVNYGLNFDSDEAMDREYFEALESGNEMKAAQIIRYRAEEMRAKVFAMTDTTAYRIRRGHEPKKTVKVYKIFTMSDDGKPTALFVSSNNKLPIGVWLDAKDTFHFTSTKNGLSYVPSTKNKYSDGGTTGTSIPISEISDEDIAELRERGYLPKTGKLPKNITALAYRPGWHAGDLPFFPQGGMRGNQMITENGITNSWYDPSKPGSNYTNIHRYNQVVFECEMIMENDYTHYNENGALEDMQEMPKDGGYKYSTNPMTKAEDLGTWYIGSSLKIVRALSQDEVDSILAKNGRLPQEWEEKDAEGNPVTTDSVRGLTEKEMEQLGLGYVAKDAKKRKELKAKGVEAYKAEDGTWRYMPGLQAPKSWYSGRLDLDALGYNPEYTDGGTKLLDTITYDDDGNIIPPSKRFDANKNDVRFSGKRKKEGDQQTHILTDRQRNILDEMEVRDIDKRVQTFAFGIEDNFHLPPEAPQRAKDMSREIAETYLATGTVSDEMKAETFNRLLENGADGQYYEGQDHDQWVGMARVEWNDAIDSMCQKLQHERDLIAMLDEAPEELEKAYLTATNKQTRAQREMEKKFWNDNGFPEHERKFIDENGTEQTVYTQLIPYKTWVRGLERGNFGRVIGMNGDKVDILFKNKSTGKSATVPMKLEEFAPVAPQMSGYVDSLLELESDIALPDMTYSEEDIPWSPEELAEAAQEAYIDSLSEEEKARWNESRDQKKYRKLVEELVGKPVPNLNTGEDRPMSLDAIQQIAREHGAELETRDMVERPEAVALAAMQIRPGKGGKYNKDLSRNLDDAAGNNKELRSLLRDIFEKPLATAKKEYTIGVEKNLTELHETIVKDLGIKPGSKESAAVQWYGEGKKYGKFSNLPETETAEYGEIQLREEFPRTWQKIKEAERFFRNKYDEYLNRINASLEKIYPALVENAKVQIEKYDSLAKYYGDMAAKQAALAGPVRAKIAKAQERMEKTKSDQAKLDMENSIHYNERRLAAIERRTEKYKNNAARVRTASGKIQRSIEDGSILKNKRLVPRQDYFHHFKEMESGFAALQNIITTNSDIDSGLANMSEYTKPLAKWASWMQKRHDVIMDADAVGGMVDYIPGAEFKIALDPYIARGRDIARIIAACTEESRNANSFLTWYGDYLNDMLGKTNPFDRPMQKLINRKTMGVVKWVNARVRANAIVGNVRTMVAQFFNLPNATYYIPNPVHWASSAAMAVEGMFNHGTAGLVMKESSFLRERYNLDSALNRFDNANAVMKSIKSLTNFMLSFGDEVVSKWIWAAAYHQGIAKNEQDPILYADDITRRSVAGRGIGEIPLTQQAQITKLVAPFQVEVNNQWELIKEAVHKTTVKGERGRAFAGIVAMLATSYIMNAAARTLVGSDISMDIINAIMEACGDWDDEDNKLQNLQHIFGRIAGELISNMPFGSQISSILISDETMRQNFFGESDPSRFGTGNIGINAVMDPIVKFFTGKDFSDDLFSLVTNIALPFGGRQIGRFVDAMQIYGILPEMYATNEGIQHYRDKGPGGTSYTSKQGIRFALDNDPITVIQTALLGQWATKEGKEFLESGSTAMQNGKKAYVDLYRELTENGMKNVDAFNLIQAVKNAQGDKGEDGKTISGSKELNQLNIIMQSNATDEEKMKIYLELAANGKKADAISGMKDAGESWTKIADAVEKYIEISQKKEKTAEDKKAEFGEWAEANLNQKAADAAKELKFTGVKQGSAEQVSGAVTNKKDAETIADAIEEGKGESSDYVKYQKIAESPVSEKSKQEAILSMMDESKSKKYQGAIDKGISSIVYFDWKVDYNAMKSDPEGTENRKEKKDYAMEYINSLNLTAEQKDYIYLTEYKESGLNKTPWH